MKNYLKSILSLNLIKKIIYKNEYSPITPLNDNVEKRKVLDILGGDLNPDKVFYVIRRCPGTGLFSNLAYGPLTYFLYKIQLDINIFKYFMSIL